MHLILTLWLALFPPATHAQAKIIQAPRAAVVRQGPGDGYKQVFILRKGERLAVTGQEGDYSRIKVKRAGQIIGGYVLRAEISGDGSKDPLAEEGWGLGFGPMYSQLTQSAKSFQTKDEVRYTTSAYTSLTVSPYVFLQYKRRNFYRAFFGYRLTRFKGSAKTDIPGAGTQSLLVQHKLISGGLQIAWSPIQSLRAFYAGFGAEAAKATAVSVELDGVELPTASDDLPVYMGVHALAGLQFFFNQTLSLTAEMRAGSYVNQSEPVFSVEAGAAVFYWF